LENGRKNNSSETSGARAARILIIDDEPVLRVTFKYLLEEEGYRVWVAANGREGLDLFSRVHPDVVITDMVMPELDGAETIRRLRALAPRLPIIAMSGAVDERLMERPGDESAFCCVRKPIEHVVLIELVRAILEPDPSIA
jgi:CheY-like chemotaxis protein